MQRDSPRMDEASSRSFSGLARLYTDASYRRLRSAHVVVVGLGGVGSWAAEALARCGVARLSLIDLDHVAQSNIQRQVQAESATVGAAKVEAMRDRIARIHPACLVDAIDQFVEPESWTDIQPILDQADAVIDACDDIDAKTLLGAWALRVQHPIFVSCGAAGGKQQTQGPQGIQRADLAHVSHDPVLAKLRYNLRKFHGAAPAITPAAKTKRPRVIGIACVYSTEPIQTPQQNQQNCSTDGSLNCAGYGSIVTVTASFGLAAANFVIQNLTA